MKSANANAAIEALRGLILIFTSEFPSELGKTYTLRDGKLNKEVAGNMAQATYQVAEFGNAQEFAELLQTIGTNQALCNSLPRNGEPTGKVLTKEKAADAGTLARTKDDFEFKQRPGILVLDYDPGEQVLTREQLWANLTAISPTTSTAAAVWWCSGSSYIHGPDGEIQGLRGQRIYLLIQDMSDAIRAGKNLTARSWLAGLGTIKLSSNGSILPRTLFDESVHQPARLDFIGGAVCRPPLTQQRGTPVLMGGHDWLDTRQAFPPLTEAEEATVKRLQADAREVAQPAAAAARAVWLETHVAKEANRLQAEGVTPENARHQARRMYENALSQTLTGDYHIPLPGGKSVTVDEVLTNPTKWHKTKTLDPLEPDHRNYQDCGILYLDGAKQCLFSFAHGGTTYLLVRQPRRIEYRQGEHARIADEMAAALCSQADIFSSGPELVTARPGGFKTLTGKTSKADIQYQLERRLSIFRTTAQGISPMNISADLAALTVAAVGCTPATTPRPLKGLTSLPYATADRSIVLQPGYDTTTGIYNTMTATPETVPDAPTRKDLVAALRTLYRPWSEYQFATDADRAAMLAAIFTAVLRPAMSLAPGAFFDAPTRGSGKTKAALALGGLMAGDHIGTFSFVEGNNEGELSKMIVALARSSRRYMLIDNIKGLFASAVLEGFFTSGRSQGRILGLSEEGDFEGRVLMLATGNNAQLGTDLARRLMVIRIDTGAVRPEQIGHSFEPADLAIDTRQGIAAAVLTILRAYWQADRISIKGGSDFREWSSLVREPIAWLAQTPGLTTEAGIGQITDPQNAFSKDEGDDPETVGHGLLLEGLRQQFGTQQVFYAKDVYACLNLDNGRIQHNPHAAESLVLVRDGVDEILGGRPVSATSVGRVLDHRKDRPHANGLKLVTKGSKTNKGRAWQVVKA